MLFSMRLRQSPVLRWKAVVFLGNCEVLTCRLFTTGMTSYSSLIRMSEARRRIQEECFKDSPEKGHEDQMKQLDNGIANLENLESKVCEPPLPAVS